MKWEDAEEVIFSSMCCILLIQIFFISRKLLTNVNKQPNKEHRPIFNNSKKLSSSEGPLRCIGENEALRGWFSYIAESFMQNRKKIYAHTKKALH